ncbi:MAG: hypothetical protein GXY25_07910 [Pirellulaceae bacterium]|jgi:hypothetical protein|nr:hypothetical protein [Thermoguttaceae bacterium]NLZ00447.1 hypothetical protein [Pirellulaceae bacterium]
MTARIESETETLEVRLLPYEGTCLLAALETLAAEARDDFPRETITALANRLDASNAVASWLGEYVRLELRPAEMVELVEVIVSTLNRDPVQPKAVGIALSNIGEKLATFGYARRNGKRT